MAIEIEFRGRPQNLERAAERVGDSLEDVGDGLRDLERDGERAAKGLGDSLEDVGDELRDLGRDGERDGGRVERALRDIADEARTTERSMDRLGDDGSERLRRLGEVGEEVGSELRQNLGETFSSFRGDLADLPQIAQDTLGGLAGSGALGGLPGLIATAVGAAGLGALIGGLDQVKERQQALEDQANDWADAYTEAGSRVLNTATITANGQAILRDRMDELKTNTDLWNVSQSTALAAMAGSPSAITEVEQSLARMTEQMERQQKIEMQDEWAEYSSELTALQSRVYDGTTALDDMTDTMSRGAEKADAYSYFLRDLADNTEGATRTVDEFGDTVVKLPDGKEIYIDAQTGQATDNVDAIERRIYSVPTSKTTIMRVDTAQAMRDIENIQSYWSKRGITIPAYTVRQDAAAARRGAPFNG